MAALRRQNKSNWPGTCAPSARTASGSPPSCNARFWLIFFCNSVIWLSKGNCFGSGSIFLQLIMEPPFYFWYRSTYFVRNAFRSGSIGNVRVRCAGPRSPTIQRGGMEPPPFSCNYSEHENLFTRIVSAVVFLLLISEKL